MASIACCSVSKILVVWTREFFANSITRSRSYMMALLAKITAITAANAAVSLREIRKFAKADNRSSEALGRPKGVKQLYPACSPIGTRSRSMSETDIDLGNQE